MSKLFNYEADQIHDMVHPNLLTDTAHYVAECKDILLTEAVPNYPKLTDYESEWLYFYENIYQGGGDPVELEYQTLEFEQHAIVHNAIPFNYKSAILKGNSIKNYKNNLFDNVLEKGSISISTGEPNDSNLRSYRSVNFIPINGKFKIAKYGVGGDVHVCFYDSNKSFVSNKTYVIRNVTEGNATVTPPTNSRFIKFYNPYDDNEPTGEFGFGVMAENEIIELEIQSVKMPVLTTTNGSANILTDTYLTKTGELSPHNNSNKAIEDYILIPNNPVIVSNVSWLYFCFYDENKNFIGTTEGNNLTKFELNDTTIPDNAKYFRFHYHSASLPLIRFVNGTDYIKATIGSEPFKTNILTVNEDLTLRSNGDVYDELNLLTGRLTQRIDENNEILAQEVVKTVDLNGGSIKPYEGTNHYYTSSDTIPPSCILSIPIESTGAKTLNDISQED